MDSELSQVRGALSHCYSRHTRTGGLPHGLPAHRVCLEGPRYRSTSRSGICAGGAWTLSVCGGATPECVPQPRTRCMLRRSPVGHPVSLCVVGLIARVRWVGSARRSPQRVCLGCVAALPSSSWDFVEFVGDHAPRALLCIRPVLDELVPQHASCALALHSSPRGLGMIRMCLRPGGASHGSSLLAHLLIDCTCCAA